MRKIMEEERKKRGRKTQIEEERKNRDGMWCQNNALTPLFLPIESKMIECHCNKLTELSLSNIPEEGIEILNPDATMRRNIEGFVNTLKTQKNKNQNKSEGPGRF